MPARANVIRTVQIWNGYCEECAALPPEERGDYMSPNQQSDWVAVTEWVNKHNDERHSTLSID